MNTNCFSYLSIIIHRNAVILSSRILYNILRTYGLRFCKYVIPEKSREEYDDAQ